MAGMCVPVRLPALGAAQDLSPPADLATADDLASPADLAPPPDLGVADDQGAAPDSASSADLVATSDQGPGTDLVPTDDGDVPTIARPDLASGGQIGHGDAGFGGGGDGGRLARLAGGGCTCAVPGDSPSLPTGDGLVLFGAVILLASRSRRRR